MELINRTPLSNEITAEHVFSEADLSPPNEGHQSSASSFWDFREELNYLICHHDKTQERKINNDRKDAILQRHMDISVKNKRCASLNEMVDSESLHDRCLSLDDRLQLAKLLIELFTIINWSHSENKNEFLKDFPLERANEHFSVAMNFLKKNTSNSNHRPDVDQLNFIAVEFQPTNSD